MNNSSFYNDDNSYVKPSGELGSRMPEGFLRDSVGKESACNAGDLGLIPGLGRSPGEGKGSLEYSGLENFIFVHLHFSRQTLGYISGLMQKQIVVTLVSQITFDL